jgi:DNA-binding LacI/PurR family transcriptional regulator
MTRPITLSEVARRAGTSAAAASRALNGRPGVRKSIREAALAAAADLSYAPHPAARNLAMRRTGLIALVVSNQELAAHTTLFSEFVSNVVAGLDNAQYQAVLLLPATEKRRATLDIRAERFDGAIVVGHHSRDGLLRHLAEHRLPTITFGRPMGRWPRSYVDVDNAGGAYAAMDHLFASGRRRIGVLGGPRNTSWGLDRLTGSRRAVEDHHAAGLFEECALSRGAGYEETLRLLRRRPGIDGLFVSAEAFLPGALAGLKQHGHAVPDDVGVVVFDDGPDQEFADPSTTSVRQPYPKLGRELARIIVELIDSPDLDQQLTLGTSLSVRRSSAPVH